MTSGSRVEHRVERLLAVVHRFDVVALERRARTSDSRTPRSSSATSTWPNGAGSLIAGTVQTLGKRSVRRLQVSYTRFLTELPAPHQRLLTGGVDREGRRPGPSRSPTEGATMKKRFAAAGLAAGLTGGAIAGIALTHPSVSGAQTDTTTETTVPAQTDESESEATRPEPGAWLSETFAPLVADGTITQAQADAVIAAIQEARPDHGLRGHRFRPWREPRRIAATAIGISTEDLRTALQGGRVPRRGGAGQRGRPPSRDRHVRRRPEDAPRHGSRVVTSPRRKPTRSSPTPPSASPRW